MDFNIVTAVQERMGFAPFEKIDPNDASNRAGLPGTSRYYEQSATLAVLAGLYRYGSDKDGALALAQPDHDTLLTTILHGQEMEISLALSNFWPHPYQETIPLMNKIAVAALDILHEQAMDNNVRKILVSQRHNILMYLPPEMQLGKTLKDNSMDDRTNKMEGPVSDLMHFFEKVFTGGE
jgi:hypothetical protein